MEYIIEKIISFFLGVVSLSYLSFVKQQTHRDMVLWDRDCNKICYPTFSQFRKHFNSTDWQLIDRYYPSMQSAEGDAYFHADIIRFNKVGFILTTYGLLRAQALRRKKAKQLLAKKTIICN